MANPLEFLEEWLFAQIEMSRELRWKHFLREQSNVREQTALQHVYSLTILMDWLLSLLQSYVLVGQKGLLKSACLLHAWADAELKRPMDLIHREPHHDVEDFAAFRARWQKLNKTTYERARRAFLLQFVGRPSIELFEPEEQATLAELTKNCSLESKLLCFARGIDFIYFGIEHLRDRGDACVLREVLSNITAEMDNLARCIPGAETVIWRDMRALCLRMAESGKFIESE